MNTVEHKTTHKSICARLLQRGEKDRNAFLARITDDETWVHHYDPLKNKINGMASSGVATQEKNSGYKLLQIRAWLASSGTVKDPC
jgi:hypothetical protein